MSAAPPRISAERARAAVAPSRAGLRAASRGDPPTSRPPRTAAFGAGDHGFVHTGTRAAVRAERGAYEWARRTHVRRHSSERTADRAQLVGRIKRTPSCGLHGEGAYVIEERAAGPPCSTDVGCGCRRAHRRGLACWRD